jgi:hypothetical protein
MWSWYATSRWGRVRVGVRVRVRVRVRVSIYDL